MIADRARGANQPLSELRTIASRHHANCGNYFSENRDWQWTVIFCDKWTISELKTNKLPLVTLSRSCTFLGRYQLFRSRTGRSSNTCPKSLLHPPQTLQITTKFRKYFIYCFTNIVSYFLEHLLQHVTILSSTFRIVQSITWSTTVLHSSNQSYRSIIICYYTIFYLLL